MADHSVSILDGALFSTASTPSQGDGSEITVTMLEA
jgi:hypothetical protein